MSSPEQPEQQPTVPTDDDGSIEPRVVEPPAIQPRVMEPRESVIAADTLTVHRFPRYKNFMILGAIVGVVLALVLTLAFPDSADFNKGQIFGFLLLACLAAGVLLGSLCALLLDRTVGRRAHTVLADRLSGDDSGAPTAADESTDPQRFNEKSE